MNLIKNILKCVLVLILYSNKIHTMNKENPIKSSKKGVTTGQEIVFKVIPDQTFTVNVDGSSDAKFIQCILEGDIDPIGINIISKKDMFGPVYETYNIQEKEYTLGELRNALNSRIESTIPLFLLKSLRHDYSKKNLRILLFDSKKKLSDEVAIPVCMCQRILSYIRSSLTNKKRDCYNFLKFIFSDYAGPNNKINDAIPWDFIKAESEVYFRIGDGIILFSYQSGQFLHCAICVGEYKDESSNGKKTKIYMSKLGFGGPIVFQRLKDMMLFWKSDVFCWVPFVEPKEKK